MVLIVKLKSEWIVYCWQAQSSKCGFSSIESSGQYCYWRWLPDTGTSYPVAVQTHTYINWLLASNFNADLSRVIVLLNFKYSKGPCKIFILYGFTQSDFFHIQLKSNSSSLCLFCIIWLVEDKVLHFDKFHEQESRNYLFSPAPKIYNNVDKNMILIKLELSGKNYYFWGLYWFVNSGRLLTHKLNIKPFGLYSVCEWFARVYTSVKFTKIKLIPIITP